MRRALLLGLLLLPAAACDGGDSRVCSLETTPRNYLLSEMIILTPDDDGVSLGFNLDGRGADPWDKACGVTDFTHPDGWSGVDNQIGVVWKMVAAIAGEAADVLIQDAIDAGDILMLASIYGGELDGDCARVELYPGAGRALSGTDGKLLPHQTFVRANEERETVGAGARAEGIISIEGVGFTLPFAVLGFFDVLPVHGGILEIVEEQDGSIRGMLGGAISLDALYEFIDRVRAFNDATSMDAGLSDAIQALTPLIPLFADLDDCQSLSAQISFRAIPAFVAQD
jgi:hypothetical protein